MARITYPSSSPYSQTPQSQWYLGNYKHRRIPPASDDEAFILEPRHQYRPDKLSQELYGTPALWWVFMLRNIDSIRDPLNDFTTGKVIIVPTLGSLKKALGI